ncbi:MAG: hypothetical protein QOI14_2047, partial [Actinomycetota bacterium]|nr:hypothetical protein [Actinomycetota bacterium]
MVTDAATPTRSSGAVQSAVVSGAGVIVAFVAAILYLAALSPHSILSGVDAALGVPSVAVSIIFFAVVLVAAVSRLAGARYGRGWYVGLVVVTAVGTVFQILVVVTNVSWFSIVLVILAVAALILAIRSRTDAVDAPQRVAGESPLALGIFLILAGLAGLTASMNLTFDDVNSKTTGAAQSCDFSLFVQCSKNLGSWEGSLFGFPNPLIGLGAFTVPLVIGIAILFGATFRRWFWIAFNLGVVFALAFVIFLIGTSIYVLGTLCLWCALVWTFTIPMFWSLSLYNLKTGNIRVSPRATKFFASALTWVPLITLVSYIVVAVLFQARLNVL